MPHSSHPFSFNNPILCTDMSYEALRAVLLSWVRAWIAGLSHSFLSFSYVGLFLNPFTKKECILHISLPLSPFIWSLFVWMEFVVWWRILKISCTYSRMCLLLNIISQFCQSTKMRTARLQLLNCMPDADVIGYGQQITYNRMSHVGLSVLLAIMQYTVISYESAAIFKLYILLDNTQLALHWSRSGLELKDFWHNSPATYF